MSTKLDQTDCNTLKNRFSEVEGCFVYDKGVYADASEAFSVNALYAIDSQINKPDGLSVILDVLSIACDALAASSQSHLAVFLISGMEFERSDLLNRDHWLTGQSLKALKQSLPGAQRA